MYEEPVDWVRISQELPYGWRLIIQSGAVEVDTKYGFYRVTKEESINKLVDLFEQSSVAEQAARTVGLTLTHWKEE